MMKSSN